MKHLNLQHAITLFFAIPFLIFSSFTFAQSHPIEGKVIDNVTKLPLQGVSVTIKNSNTGIITNADGKFSLEVPDNSKLEVTFIGYQPTEMNASQKNTIIQLTPLLKQLNEVVITASGIRK